MRFLKRRVGDSVARNSLPPFLPPKDGARRGTEPDEFNRTTAEIQNRRSHVSLQRWKASLKDTGERADRRCIAAKKNKTARSLFALLETRRRNIHATWAKCEHCWEDYHFASAENPKFCYASKYVTRLQMFKEMNDGRGYIGGERRVTKRHVTFEGSFIKVLLCVCKSENYNNTLQYFTTLQGQNKNTLKTHMGGSCARETCPVSNTQARGLR